MLSGLPVSGFRFAEEQRNAEAAEQHKRRLKKLVSPLRSAPGKALFPGDDRKSIGQGNHCASPIYKLD
jgi:hypothetical protein